MMCVYVSFYHILHIFGNIGTVAISFQVFDSHMKVY